MSISLNELKKVANLAYLVLDEESNCARISQEINSIIRFVDELGSVDTEGVEPLSHPFSLTQPLRPDEVTEKDCLNALKAIAPLFEDGLYLVPKVIHSSQ